MYVYIHKFIFIYVYKLKSVSAATAFTLIRTNRHVLNNAFVSWHTDLDAKRLLRRDGLCSFT